VLKARDDKPASSRIKADCMFTYLYMAGTKDSYELPKEKNGKNQGQEAVEKTVHKGFL